MTQAVRVAAITVSDTRTEADDLGGAALKERLEAAGFVVSLRLIVKDEPEQVRAAIARVCDDDLADAIVTTGGTGIAPRDRTYEAIESLLDKKLDGFGEAFRRLSWDEVGARSIPLAGGRGRAPGARRGGSARQSEGRGAGGRPGSLTHPGTRRGARPG